MNKKNDDNELKEIIEKLKGHLIGEADVLRDLVELAHSMGVVVHR